MKLACLMGLLISISGFAGELEKPNCESSLSAAKFNLSAFETIYVSNSDYDLDRWRREAGYAFTRMLSLRDQVESDRARVESLPKRGKKQPPKWLKERLRSGETDLNKVTGNWQELEGKINKYVGRKRAREAQISSSSRVTEAYDQAVQANPNLEVHFNDFMTYKQIDRLPPGYAIPILADPGDGPEFEHEREQVISLVSYLLSKGHVVLVDGHAAFSKQLVSLGEKVWAISTRPMPDLPEAQNFVITNSYLYANAFRDAVSVGVFTPSSVLGIGRAMLKQTNVVIADVDTKFSRFSNKLHEWVNSTNSAFGMNLKSYDRPDELKLYGDSITGFNRWSSPWRSEEKTILKSVRPILETLSMYDVHAAAEYANNMSEGYRQAFGPEAVLFGSGSKADAFSELIYNISFDIGSFGLGMATGGAGGAMMWANRGAYDGGGESMGIPISGRHALVSEKTTYRDVQTQTVNASDYNERIPWLLAGRKIILNAPGGSGTMREIAASLVELSINEDAGQIVLFLGRKYYGGFVDFLMSCSIPQRIKDRIFLVDNTTEFHNVVRESVSNGKLKLNKRRTVRAPRAERLSFQAK